MEERRHVEALKRRFGRHSETFSVLAGGLSVEVV
jgi:hypothetical protein